MGAPVTTAPDSSVTATTTGPDPRFGMQGPIVQAATVTTPGGLSASVTGARNATLADPSDPFSLTSQLDSVRINGRLFLSTYTAADRRAVQTSPEGRQSFTTLDSLGRVVGERVPGLDSLIYRYDANGRLDEVQTGGRIATYTYDTLGRLATLTDPLGQTDSLFYDSADRLERQVLWGGRVVQYDYDAAGNLTNLTPPGRPAHVFRYTAVGLALLPNSTRHFSGDMMDLTRRWSAA